MTKLFSDAAGRPIGTSAAGTDFCRDCVISWGFGSYGADFMNGQGSIHEINHHGQVLMN